MKQEIEKIIYRNYPDTDEEIDEKCINQILNLFPKWRVPSVDGFPESNQNVLYQEHEYPTLVMSGYGFHQSINTDEGVVIECDRIKCWLPVSEFLKIMEVNK